MRQQLLEPAPFDQAREPIQHSIAAGSLRQQCFHKARLSRPLYRHRHLPKAKPQRITTIKLRNRPTRGEGWGEGSTRGLPLWLPLTHITSAMQCDLSHRARGEPKSRIDRFILRSSFAAADFVGRHMGAGEFKRRGRDAERTAAAYHVAQDVLAFRD